MSNFHSDSESFIHSRGYAHTITWKQPKQGNCYDRCTKEGQKYVLSFSGILILSGCILGVQRQN